MSSKIEFNDGSAIIRSDVRVNEGEDAKRLITQEISDLGTYYSIPEIVEVVKTHAYQRLALQFPDSLLEDAVAVVKELKNSLGDRVDLFVLGDTSYGSCCVDEVAAKHYNADCVLHFGRSCMSLTSSLPVIYAYGKQAVDVEYCAQAFTTEVHKSDAKNILFMYQCCYHHVSKHIYERLCQLNPNRKIEYGRMRVFYSPSDHVDDVDSKNVAIIGGQEFELDLNDLDASSLILYVGKETLHLTTILMRCNQSTCYTFNPTTRLCRQETMGVNKSLMRRYFLVQKAKEAQIIGVLIGTLVAAKYLDVIQRIQELIRMSGRKYYTFIVGKINVPKLANFAEIDVFVYVACPENSTIDSKEFYKPLVTPYELELALTHSDWTGQYRSDLREVSSSLQSTLRALQEEPNFVDHADNDEGKKDDDMRQSNEDEPFFSLISGTLKSVARSKTSWKDGAKRGNSSKEKDTKESDATNDVLALRNRETHLIAYENPAAELFAQREYQGLKPRIGATPVHAAMQGHFGIASGYEMES